ncbi:MAG: PH domain-containing protein [Halodesulfurarchaeum sp.]
MSRLSPRVQVQWGLRAIGAAAVLGAIVAILTYWTGWRDPILGLPTFAIAGSLLLVVAHLKYRIWRYDVLEDSLFLHRGVFTRVRTVVPYVRVQHVDTQRNPIERLLGLSRVVVYTAGSRGADVSIPGLTNERAESLQEELRQLAGEHDTDDGV